MFRSLSIFLVCLTLGSATAGVVVENHEDGSAVRYPVVLLRGTVDPDASSLELKNSATSNDEEDYYTLVRDGRFKALVMLAEGENVIALRTAPDAPVTTIRLTYKPSTNPHYIRLIWMTDKGGDTAYATPSDDMPQDYEARLRTAALLMQTFTAERAHDLGYPRQTFTLERGKDGEPIVHTLKAPETADYYYGIGNDQKWWGEVHGWLDREHPDEMAKNMVLAAFTRKDPESGKMRAHTALGGGRLGLFGSASVFSWPTSLRDAATVFMDDTRVDPARVHDDSAGRGTVWGLASTTIGASLHEMGHTFGLPHCKDGLGIMTRGFDRFNRVFTFADPPSRVGLKGVDFEPDDEAYFAPISMAYLRWSRWFQSDPVRYRGDERPVITHDPSDGDSRVSVEAKRGVRWVGFWVGSEVVGFKEFPDAAPDAVRFSAAEIAEIIGDRRLSTITVISDNGRQARLNIPD